MYQQTATAKVVYCITITTNVQKCLPFTETQAPEASLQGEDPDCGGVAAVH